MDKKEKDQESIRNKYENDLKEIKRLEGIIQQQIEWSQERNYITAASKQKDRPLRRAHHPYYGYQPSSDPYPSG